MATKKAVKKTEADLRVEKKLEADLVEILEPEKPVEKAAPDIQGRFQVLMATRQDHLVDWVMGFPNMPNLKTEEYAPSQAALAAAILIHEYGTVAYLKWRLMLDRER